MHEGAGARWGVGAGWGVQGGAEGYASSGRLKIQDTYLDDEEADQPGFMSMCVSSHFPLHMLCRVMHAL